MLLGRGVYNSRVQIPSCSNFLPHQITEQVIVNYVIYDSSFKFGSQGRIPCRGSFCTSDQDPVHSSEVAHCHRHGFYRSRLLRDVNSFGLVPACGLPNLVTPRTPCRPFSLFRHKTSTWTLLKMSRSSNVLQE